MPPLRLSATDQVILLLEDKDQRPMASKKVSTRKLKDSRPKVSRKLYKSLKKEAKRNDLSVSDLALGITERGITKRRKSKT